MTLSHLEEEGLPSEVEHELNSVEDQGELAVFSLLDAPHQP